MLQILIVGKWVRITQQKSVQIMETEKEMQMTLNYEKMFNLTHIKQIITTTRWDFSHIRLAKWKINIII